MTDKKMNHAITAALLLSVTLPAAWATKAMIDWNENADCIKYVAEADGSRSFDSYLPNAECRKEIPTELAVDSSGFCLEVVVKSQNTWLEWAFNDPTKKSSQVVAFRCKEDCEKFAERKNTKITNEIHVLGGYRRQIKWEGFPTSRYAFTGKIEKLTVNNGAYHGIYQGNVDPVAVYCESNPNATITKDQVLDFESSSKNQNVSPHYPKRPEPYTGEPQPNFQHHYSRTGTYYQLQPGMRYRTFSYHEPDSSPVFVKETPDTNNVAREVTEIEI